MDFIEPKECLIAKNVQIILNQYHHEQGIYDIFNYSCELYDAYVVDNDYLLNFIYFDPTANSSVKEVKGIDRQGSFYGPFDEKLMIFLSLQKPFLFDVENFEYEEMEDSIKEGHIFALETIQQKKEISSSTHLSHYRVLRNLGSRLKSFGISNWIEGKVFLLYEDGDMCNESSRYSTEIILVCDKNNQQFTNIIPYENADCIKKFIWKTRFACSLCKLNETIQYQVKIQCLLKFSLFAKKARELLI